MTGDRAEPSAGVLLLNRNLDDVRLGGVRFVGVRLSGLVSLDGCTVDEVALDLSASAAGEEGLGGDVTEILADSVRPRRWFCLGDSPVILGGVLSVEDTER